MQRVGDRARAVIAGRLERAVAAAPDVRPGGDFIARRDHPRDDARGRLRRRRPCCWTTLPPEGLRPGRARRRRCERALSADAEHAHVAGPTTPSASGRGGPAGGGPPPRFPGRIRRPAGAAARPAGAAPRCRRHRGRFAGCRAVIAPPAVPDVATRHGGAVVGSGQGRGRRCQRFLAAHADHAPRRGPDDAVHGEAVAGLQAADAASVSGPNSPSAGAAARPAAAERRLPPAFGRAWPCFARVGGVRSRCRTLPAALAAWCRSGSGRAEAGGVSVSWPCTPSTLHVAGPTTPSTVSPWRACSRRIAASVSGPNSPSARSRCSALCSCATASPPLAVFRWRRRIPHAAPRHWARRFAGELRRWTLAVNARPGSPGRAARRPSAGPTTPSTVRPALAWKRAHGCFGFGTEDAVDFDAAEGLLEQFHLPAFAARAERRSCVRSSSAVRGSGRPELIVACPSARLAVGPTRERRQRTQRDPLGARARGHEAQLGGTPARARAAQRQLPRLLLGEVARLAQAGRARRAARTGRGGSLALLRARLRPARARRARERSSEASQGSTTARSRGDPDMRRRPFSICLAPTGLAVGLA